MGSTQTHLHYSGSEAEFWFGGLNFPLPVRWTETQIHLTGKFCTYSFRGEIHMSFLLPRPGTSGLSTKWQISKLYAHLWSKTLKPKEPSGRCYVVLAVFWVGGSAITWMPAEWRVGSLCPWLTCISSQVLAHVHSSPWLLSSGPVASEA